VPELPEVEVLKRYLAPLLKGKTIRSVQVRRQRVIRPTAVAQLQRTLRGATFSDLSRRGKFLVFTLRKTKAVKPIILIGHLGMSGRMYLLPAEAPLPKHTALVLGLGKERFVFEDTRYFGRFTLDGGATAKLGPEPLSSDFSFDQFAEALRRSRQPIKVKLLDQRVVAGIGNIYASEALFEAGISPSRPAASLTAQQIKDLRDAIRRVLERAINGGSTVPLDFEGKGRQDRLFYFGRSSETPSSYSERLEVYDRAGEPCPRCATVIKRRVQAARSTFYCPQCQRR